MTVFLNIIKRLLKNKVQIGIMFILPFLPLIPIVLDNSEGTMQTINIGFVDQDQTEVTQSIKEGLGLSTHIIEIEEQKVEESINTSSIDYALVIPKGYTEGLINQDVKNIQGYAKEEKDLTPIIRKLVDGYVNPAKDIAVMTNGNREAFNQGFAAFHDQYLKEVEKEMSNAPKKNTNIAWGMVVQFVMFSSIFASTIIVNDKENKTFFRTLYAPISLKSYMVQSILSFLVISLLQIYLIAAVLVYGFDIQLGSSFVTMISFLSLIALVSVSFGIAISSISKNSTQSTMVGSGLTTLMCMVGGAWGMKPTSEIISSIGKLMPVTWIMEAIEEINRGVALSEITNHIIVLITFVIIFFLLGTWKKVDIVK